MTHFLCVAPNLSFTHLLKNLPGLRLPLSPPPLGFISADITAASAASRPSRADANGWFPGAAVQTPGAFCLSRLGPNVPKTRASVLLDCVTRSSQSTRSPRSCVSRAVCLVVKRIDGLWICCLLQTEHSVYAMPLLVVVPQLSPPPLGCYQHPNSFSTIHASSSPTPQLLLGWHRNFLRNFRSKLLRNLHKPSHRRH